MGQSQKKHVLGNGAYQHETSLVHMHGRQHMGRTGAAVVASVVDGSVMSLGYMCMVGSTWVAPAQQW